MKKLLALVSFLSAIQISANTEFTAITNKLHNICAPLIYQSHIIEKKLEPSEEKYKTDVEKTIAHYTRTSEQFSVEKKAEIVAAYKNMHDIESLKNILTTLYGEKWAKILINLLQQIAQEQIVDISLVNQALEAVKAHQTFSEYSYQQLQKNQQAIANAEPEAIEKALLMLRQGQSDQETFINKVIINLLNPPA